MVRQFSVSAWRSCSVPLALAALYCAFISSAGCSVSPIANLLSAFTCSYDTEFINFSATAVCRVVLCCFVLCRVVLLILYFVRQIVCKFSVCTFSRRCVIEDSILLYQDPVFVVTLSSLSLSSLLPGFHCHCLHCCPVVTDTVFFVVLFLLSLFTLHSYCRFHLVFVVILFYCHSIYIVTCFIVTPFTLSRVLLSLHLHCHLF